jgi:hypothetical protein
MLMTMALLERLAAIEANRVNLRLSELSVPRSTRFR